MKNKKDIEEMLNCMGTALIEGHIRSPTDIYPYKVLEEFNMGTNLGLCPKERDDLRTFRQALLWVLEQR